MSKHRQNTGLAIVAAFVFVICPITLAFCGGTPDPQPTTTTIEATE